MKTWQRTLLCVLFCVVGINSVVYAWPWPSITLSVDREDIRFFDIWDGEVQVSSDDQAFSTPSITGTPEGDLYAVYEAREYDDDGTELTTSTLFLSYSFDGGQNWEDVLRLHPSGPGRSFHNPSITYLEKGTQKLICVAYAEYYGSIAEIRVFRMDVGPNPDTSFETVGGILSIGTPYEIYPEICTDYPLETSNPYLYVTYSGRFWWSGDSYPVEVYRSQDLGQTWNKLQFPYTRDVEVPDWPKRPDIEYGSAGLFVAYNAAMPSFVSFPGYDAAYDAVVIKKSTDRGDHWSQSFEEGEPLIGMISHPRISAAIDNPSVLVAYTLVKRDIIYAYSPNGGNTWETPLALAMSSDIEKDVELGRSKSGGKFYATYWQGGDIIYTTVNTTTEPWSWTSPIVINEGHAASALYAKPSIHFDPVWPNQEAVIAWTDERSEHSQIYLGTSYSENPFIQIGGSKTMSYTVTVENIFEDLNTLTVTNQLSDLVTYTSGSIAVNGVVQEPLAVTDGLWTYTTADLAYGDVLTFSFDVVVDTGIDPGDLISNLINVQYVYGLSNTLLEYSREVVIYVETIPEPATWALLGLGLLGGGLLLRRKRRARTR